MTDYIRADRCSSRAGPQVSGESWGEVGPQPTSPASLTGALSTPGSLDTSSPITSEPEAFFSMLQKFREANREDCVCGSPE